MTESLLDRTSLERQLAMARQVLAVYEEQAAGHTALTIPAQLKVNLDEQRSKVAELKAKLAALRLEGGKGENDR